MSLGLGSEYRYVLREVLTVSVNGYCTFKASGLSLLEAGLQGIAFATVFPIADDHCSKFFKGI